MSAMEDVGPVVSQKLMELGDNYGISNFGVGLKKPYNPLFYLGGWGRARTYIYTGGTYWLVFVHGELLLEPITLFKDEPCVLAPNELWVIEVEDPNDQGEVEITAEQLFFKREEGFTL